MVSVREKVENEKEGDRGRKGDEITGKVTQGNFWKWTCPVEGHRGADSGHENTGVLHSPGEFSSKLDRVWAASVGSEGCLVRVWGARARFGSASEAAGPRVWGAVHTHTEARCCGISELWD